MKALVSFDQCERPIDWSRQFPQDQGTPGPRALEVEIGFGLGEYLLRMAQQHPERDFIGIEQDWERVKKTLRKLGDTPNVRILWLNAGAAFERLFHPRTIQRIHCLFPCPWPKKRHVKYRLFARDFLRLMNSRLVDGGQVHIVTDHLPYADWILEQSGQTGFQADITKSRPCYDTKYERKWRQEGRNEFFDLRLSKQEHVAIPVKRDEPLKSYWADRFDPDRFHPGDFSGSGITIVVKDFLYDAKQEIGMQYLIIAEANLTQHVWIKIARGPRGWLIGKAPGQNTFPTRGIAKGLELVYQAVVQDGI